MDDTTLEIKKIIHDRYMTMSGEQRLLIGAEMFDTARELVLASFPKNISKQEKQRLLCQRFYGSLAEKVFP